MRTILFTYKDMSAKEYDLIKDDIDKIESDMVCLSLFALMDPLKADVPDSISRCNRAGINIIMCTGDNLETAKSIAEISGKSTQKNLDKWYTCMTGK